MSPLDRVAPVPLPDQQQGSSNWVRSRTRIRYVDQPVLNLDKSRRRKPFQSIKKEEEEELEYDGDHQPDGDEPTGLPDACLLPVHRYCGHNDDSDQDNNDATDKQYSNSINTRSFYFFMYYNRHKSSGNRSLVPQLSSSRFYTPELWTKQLWKKKKKIAGARGATVPP